MNSVQIMGRLTKEPDVRIGQKKIARFTLAVKRDKETSDFINCVAFDKTADFAERYLRKGKRAIVEGRIQTGSYEKDGRKVYTTDVIANKLTAIDYEQVEYAQPQPQPEIQRQPQQMRTNTADQEWNGSSLDIDPSDLPF